MRAITQVGSLDLRKRPGGTPFEMSANIGQLPISHWISSDAVFPVAGESECKKHSGSKFTSSCKRV